MKEGWQKYDDLDRPSPSEVAELYPKCDRLGDAVKEYMHIHGFVVREDRKMAAPSRRVDNTIYVNPAQLPHHLNLSAMREAAAALFGDGPVLDLTPPKRQGWNGRHVVVLWAAVGLAVGLAVHVTPSIIFALTHQ